MNFLKPLLTQYKSKINKIRSLDFTRRFSKILCATEKGENLLVKFEDREESYPVIWLRDNCTCKECYHEQSQSRILIWKNFDVDPKINEIKIVNNESVQVTWNGHHKSNFSAKWLTKRSFNSGVQSKYLEEYYKPKRNFWDKNEFFSVLKTYSYQKIINDDEILRDWLLDLAVNGITILNNVPSSLNTCRTISEKVAFIKKTHFGEDFHVISKVDPSNPAYIPDLSFQFHIDLPFYRYVPGVVLLHCLVQVDGKGGETLISDGINAAEELRDVNKKAFDILSNVEVNWYNIGEENGVKFHKIYRSPVINLNKVGEVEEIRYSVTQRDSHFTTDIKIVPSWYKSLKLFSKKLFDNMVKIKLKPGQILAFDNTRMVHGREKYEDSSQNQRHLVGNYLDWDEILSKLRVLRTGIKQN